MDSTKKPLSSSSLEETIAFSLGDTIKDTPREAAERHEKQVPEQCAYTALLRHFSTPVPLAARPTEHADPRIHHDILSPSSLRAAAVLIAVSRPSNAQASRVVLTLRSEKLKSHAGQVSLPGGTCDEEDADVIDTALREAEEEVGLARAAVEVIGQMGEISLPSGFRITPVIGLTDAGLTLPPCPDEVADIFHPPLDLLLDPRAYSRSVTHYRGADRTIFELPYEGFRIWGATAAILYSLAKQVSR